MPCRYEFNITMLPISWSLRLTHLTVIMLLFFAISLFVVPACLKNLRGAAILVIVQAILLTLLEEVLYEQEGGFYSSFLIFFTTILGLVTASSLYGSQRLNINQTCVLMSSMFIILLFLILFVVYISKVAILMAPDIRMAFLATFITSLSFTRLYLAYVSDESIPSNQGWLYLICSGLALLVTRNIVVARILSFVVDPRYYALTESRIMGAALFTWGLSLLPLSVRFMRYFFYNNNTLIIKLK